MPDFRAALGRGTDRMMGHLTPGEAIIPRGAMTPKLFSAFNEALSKQGMMPEQYIVGSKHNSINPLTGQPEFQARAANVHASSRTRDIQDRFGGREFGGASVQGPEGGVTERGGVVTDRPGTEAYARDVQAITGTTTGDQVTELMEPLAPTYSPEGGLDLGFLNALPFIGPFVEAGNRYGGGLSPEALARLDRLERTRRDPDQMQGMSRDREMRELSFTRPVETPAPQILGLSSAMSPLQMRTAVASRAVAGQGGEYTSPEAATFYDNLLQRALIDDSGTLAGLDTLLPIDLQYLGQIRGIENPTDTQSLLAALLQ